MASLSAHAVPSLPFRYEHDGTDDGMPPVVLTTARRCPCCPVVCPVGPSSFSMTLYNYQRMHSIGFSNMLYENRLKPTFAPVLLLPSLRPPYLCSPSPYPSPFVTFIHFAFLFNEKTTRTHNKLTQFIFWKTNNTRPTTKQILTVAIGLAVCIHS